MGSGVMVMSTMTLIRGEFTAPRMRARGGMLEELLVPQDLQAQQAVSVPPARPGLLVLQVT